MLYEVSVFQEYQGQQCINRYTYLRGGTLASVSGSFALTSAMGYVSQGAGGAFTGGSPAVAIQEAQSNGLSYRTVITRALFDDLDFYERPFISATSGLQSGTGAAPFLAYGFRSNRVRLDVGRTYKRFAGVVEEAMGAGGNITGTFVAQMSDIATRLGNVLTYVDEGQNVTFTPVVLSLEPYDPDTGLADPDGTARRLYPTLPAQLARTAVGVLFEPYAQVRSQVSRQIGRGR